MLWFEKIYKAPPHSGAVVLGRTLPSLLDEACDRTPNPLAFNQWTETGWQSFSNQTVRTAAEELALGLQELGLNKGDRLSLLMHSDVHFCVADMGCLIANVIDVPIDLTQTLENIIFILKHSESKGLMISNLDLLYQVVPYLWDVPDLRHIIVTDVPQNGSRTLSQQLACPPDTMPDWGNGRTPINNRPHPDPSTSACLCIPTFLNQAHLDRPCPQLPPWLQVFSLAEVQARGHAPEVERKQLRSSLSPDDVATIIYIPGTTGELQGVILTHENLSVNALAAFTGLPDLRLGAEEVVLSFLPLTHVFARALLYGHINYGHLIYFTTPNRVIKHLQEVRPTLFATVPLLLEKFHGQILEKSTKRIAVRGRHPERTYTQLLLSWTLKLAKRYKLGHRPVGWYALQLALANQLVFSHWRSLFGGRLKYVLCGGAPLKAELANQFAAAGILILQGYGLTQTSSVVSYNRGSYNRAGTVGMPLAGVEIEIADDGEVLVKGPSVTPGYYKNPEATRAAIDQQGWFHTGDLGEFTAEGFLKITGIKKDLFKLSTGKYVTPQPLEYQLKQSQLVEQAIVVGAERKFCAMLIFPNLLTLRAQADAIGIDLPTEALLKHPCILALYQTLVDEANCHLPYWSTVKRFLLINAQLTVENGLLTPTRQVRRAKMLEVFAKEIDTLYGIDVEVNKKSDIARQSVQVQDISLPMSEASCPPSPAASCPVFAQSLDPSLTN
jgi:long-chain acyl-CoA synthetase